MTLDETFPENLTLLYLILLPYPHHTLTMSSIVSLFVALAAFAVTARAGKTETITNWGDNPTNLPGVLVYTPDKLSSSPAVILGVGLPFLTTSPPLNHDTAPPLRRNRATIPTNVRPKHLRRQTRSRSPLPDLEISIRNELLGRALLQIPNAQWRRRLARARRDGQMGSTEVRWERHASLRRRRIFRSHGDERVGCYISRCV